MHPDALILIRIAKWLAVCAFATGTLGAAFSRAHDERERFAYRFAGPGFGGSWVFGFGLALGLGVSLMQAWILGALVLSVISLNATLFLASRPERATGGARALSVGTFIATVVWMVTRW